jgi:3-dehydroquinate synthase
MKPAALRFRIQEGIKEYPVFVGYSLMDNAVSLVRKSYAKRRIVIITDSHIFRIYKRMIDANFRELRPLIITLAPGESSKTRKVKQKIEDLMLSARCGRDTLIIAIGGGVVGDIAGFVASTYNRGIPYIQIPTSLLAMIDSSIGGKTGVNTGNGKNLIGTIWQPAAVYADLNFLDTLPMEEYRNGLAEMVKIAAACSRKLFSSLEENAEMVILRDRDFMPGAICESVRLKKRIVEKDPDEKGLRQTLNLGHTIGHALESYYGYRKKHGYCVSLGLIAESRISVLRKEMDAGERKRLCGLMAALDLPTEIDRRIDAGKLIKLMYSDKKNKGHAIQFVILDGIGSVKKKEGNFTFPVEESVIKRSLREGADA